MSEETKTREEICAVGASLFQRGLTFGSTGNISVRLADGGWLMTPTNASLGSLDPARLSRLDADGRLDRWRSRDQGGVPSSVHVPAATRRRGGGPSALHPFGRGQHSRRCRPAGCAAPAHRLFRDAGRAAAAGALFPPGDEALGKAVEKLAGRHHAVLLANHGPVVAGSSLANAQYAAEELEETAKLYLMLRSMPIRPLTADEVETLRKRYNLA